MSSFQDDIREKEMINLFDLYKDEDEGRGGTDAYLNVDGDYIPFELKTTSNGSVTTVRDFGINHIKKWKNKHWLIGFFIKGEEFYHYGSPEMMKPWIDEKLKYIEKDYMLANIVSEKLNIDDLFKIIDKKSIYTIEDAKSIQKKQYKKAKYIELQDKENGYSPEIMLEILKDRSRYLIERGSTLNNPHIPYSYFKGWKKIKSNHIETIRKLVIKN